MPWGYNSTLKCLRCSSHQTSSFHNRRPKFLCLHNNDRPFPRTLLKSCEWRLQTPVLSNSWISMHKQCNWCLRAFGNFPSPSLQRERARESLATRHFLNSVKSNCQSVWTGFGSDPTCWLFLMVAKILKLSVHSLIFRAQVLFIDLCSNFLSDLLVWGKIWLGRNWKHCTLQYFNMTPSLTCLPLCFCLPQLPAPPQQSTTWP